MADSPVQVGGAYQESEDHVPNPTDMVAQFNTSGLGAHGRIEEVSPIFEVDKVKTAQEILAATDPDNDAVGSDRVLLPNPVEDNDVALDQITELAERRVEKGVVIGGPTPAESEAELEGDEGVLAAVEQERSNAAANSTGNRQAGQHEGTVSSDEGKDDTALAGSRLARGETTTGSTDTSDEDDDDEAEDDEEDYYESLKGESLEKALEDRDLSKSGTADEKRARVKEYDEEQEDSTS
jgi:hypothetical protein